MRPRKCFRNRKNAPFAAHPRGGRTAAILASLTSTCRQHDLDPQLYLTQLLMNLPTWSQRDLDAWLPDQWNLRYAARLTKLDQQNSTTPDTPQSVDTVRERLNRGDEMSISLTAIVCAAY